jgi:pyroglutamyl-peptidase
MTSHASILLTGFGAFPGIPDNATARLVPVLAGAARTAFPDHCVHAEILKTEWADAPARVEQLLAEHRPDLALHFGVARDARGFRIERCARNTCHATVDAMERLPPARHVLAGGADTHAVGIPADAIVRHLKDEGYPAAASDDAGGYLCNAVLYHSLHHGRAHGTRAGFVHLPADLSGPPLPFADALSGSLEILKVCLHG